MCGAKCGTHTREKSMLTTSCVPCIVYACLRDLYSYGLRHRSIEPYTPYLSSSSRNGAFSGETFSALWMSALHDKGVTSTVCHKFSWQEMSQSLYQVAVSLQQRSMSFLLRNLQLVHNEIDVGRGYFNIRRCILHAASTS